MPQHVTWFWIDYRSASASGAQALMVDDSSFDRCNRPGWKKMKWQDWLQVGLEHVRISNIFMALAA